MTFDPTQPPAGYKYLFHYTDYASAQAILEDQVHEVRNDGKYGPGLYVTDVVPDADYLDDAQNVAADSKPIEALDGVLVYLDTDPPSFFAENRPGNWSHHAQIWDNIDVETVIALGRFDGETWRWEES